MRDRLPNDLATQPLEAEGLLEESEWAVLAGCEQEPGARLILDLLRAELRHAGESRRISPAERPENWQLDVRWLLARESVLESLVSLPQRARAVLGAATRGDKP